MYKVGKPGVAWGEVEIEQWLNQTSIQRSYQSDVVDKIFSLSDRFKVERYGALDVDPIAYPLFSLQSEAPKPAKPWVLITGGVHGYESSGIQGALAFLETSATKFEVDFNFLVLPCISPWAYETINRWNPLSLDPNRCFKREGLCQESRLAIECVRSAGSSFIMHMDLHETTDTDESEFRPALAAKLGEDYEPTEIPDGFYLVGDIENPMPEFQSAIIQAVSRCTHIAQCDDQGRLLGDQAAGHGIVNYAVRRLGLCAGMTDAPYTTTTEVYPDSAHISSADCVAAQVCALEAGLEFVKGASQCDRVISNLQQ